MAKPRGGNNSKRGGRGRGAGGVKTVVVKRSGLSGRGGGRGSGGRPQRGRAVQGGRGGRGRMFRGRGRGGRGKKGRESGRTKTKEELDAEMDEYFLKGDEKTAQKKLNDDLDEYWKNKPVTTEEDVAEGVDNVADEGEGASAE